MHNKATQKEMLKFFDPYREVLAEALINPLSDDEMKNMVREIIYDIDHNLLKMDILAFGALVQLVINIQHNQEHLDLIKRLTDLNIQVK